MKKTLIFILVLFLSCTDDEGNPCVYQPTLTTEAVTNITETSATLNGVINIFSENCDVAPGEMQGFVYSTNPSPTNDDNVEVVYGTDIIATIDNLIPNTTYYVRVFITNSLGEFYGNEVEFTTNEEVTEITNCDGNPVPTIVYGSQEWAVENACHITYRDGTPIPQITNITDWANLTTGAWCYNQNNPENSVMYNWYAIAGIDDNDPNTPNKEFAPVGWHVPTEAEWTTLEEYLIANGYNYDGTTVESKIAKSMASKSGWLPCTSQIATCPNAPGTNQNLNNSSGFNAFPEGSLGINSSNNSSFVNKGKKAYFWTSTENNTNLAYWRMIYHYNHVLDLGDYTKNHGLTVRLIKD